MSLQQAKPAQSLDLSMVKPADIILTTTDSASSSFIRTTTCGDYSHAILALKNGKCIQAMPESGVEIVDLPNALRIATHATLYRHKSINDEYAAWVCHFAKEQTGKEYDAFGAMRSGASTGCGLVKNRAKSLVYLVELVHDSTQKRAHNNKFFCSELVASSFEKSFLPLFDDIPSYAMTPKILRSSNKLTLIKELITT